MVWSLKVGSIRICFFDISQLKLRFPNGYSCEKQNLWEKMGVMIRSFSPLATINRHLLTAQGSGPSENRLLKSGVLQQDGSKKKSSEEKRRVATPELYAINRHLLTPCGPVPSRKPESSKTMVAKSKTYRKKKSRDLAGFCLFHPSLSNWFTRHIKMSRAKSPETTIAGRTGRKKVMTQSLSLLLSIYKTFAHSRCFWTIRHIGSTVNVAREHILPISHLSIYSALTTSFGCIYGSLTSSYHLCGSSTVLLTKRDLRRASLKGMSFPS